MKKLLLVIAASLASVAGYAQVDTAPTTQYDDYGAKELTCTEKAVSFRADLRSGWQISSFRIGYTDAFNTPSGLASSKSYAEGEIIPEPIQLIKAENAANQDASPLNTTFMFPETSTWNFLTQTGQLANNYFIYDYTNFLRPIGSSLMASSLNQLFEQRLLSMSSLKLP